MNVCVFSPQPGCVNTTEVDIKKSSRMKNPHKTRKVLLPSKHAPCPHVLYVAATTHILPHIYYHTHTTTHITAHTYYHTHTPHTYSLKVWLGLGAVLWAYMEPSVALLVKKGNSNKIRFDIQ